MALGPLNSSNFEQLELKGLNHQLWITSVRNDLPQFAIDQIVAFFMDNMNAIKINNLIVERW